ncbi:bifunctional homocysteine S-methyltransferase/methylenetetrahydrofolate reductase [Promineifilum sp.]|uniref:bifunctional homocysteine S-methyltransferase/methylenetetrahydrofolate reductase n=1 Tax=Promineifilum sp. TaxID=2664178 RepID=UPI0035B41828
MNRQEFKQRLEQGPVLMDGAFGTVLHGRGVPIDQSFDAVNLTNPALVAEIHRGYIDAGSELIETNTFGANRFKLTEHGLQHQVEAINRAAVAVARRVIAGSFKDVLLAGSVGPLGARLAPLGRVSAAEAEAAFAEQIAALTTAEPQGVDLLIIETMSDIKEVEAAVSAARRVAPDVPIVAEMTFTRDDKTLLGYPPDVAAAGLASLDVDAIGINCSGGPAQVLRLISIVRQVTPELPVSASPNAGWPEQMHGGRVMYPATPDYFGDYARAFQEAGVSLIGGCCGTTAAHIRAMRRALDTPGESPYALPEVRIVSRTEKTIAVVDRPTQLAQHLSRGQLVLTVEMNPPKGVAAERLLAGARMLREAGANFLNIADSPLARMRMSAWAAAYLVQKQIGLEAVLHFPTRGRNLLRIQGDLLAAHAMGIRNLFVTMGDPTRIGDYPEAMDSYDIVPTGLIELIKKQFNQGLDKAGLSIDQPTTFVVGCALSLTPKDVGAELRLLRKKVEHGADFALTQPVFDAQVALNFLDAYEQAYGEPPPPILAGLKPLYNSRNAEFLHHEVPGIYIPEEQRERMRQAERPQAEGVRIAQEIAAALRPRVQGFYIMPAFGRYDLVADVLDMFGE